jgi:hypothetical protein
MPGFYGFSASAVVVMPIRRCFHSSWLSVNSVLAHKTGTNRTSIYRRAGDFVTAFQQFAQMVEAIAALRHACGKQRARLA